MAKCKQCGTELRNITGKMQKQFCGDAHRKAYKRAELKKSEAPASPLVDELRTVSTKLPTSDNLGHSFDYCQYCEGLLPVLQEPRKYPGTCYRCAIEQPTKAGHTLNNRLAFYSLEYTGNMTVMERLFYRPGQSNFVSKPGCACYGVLS